MRARVHESGWKKPLFCAASAARLSHKFIAPVELCACRWQLERGMSNTMHAGKRRWAARSRLAVIALDAAERSQLEQWSRRRRLAPSLAVRARIVLGGRAGRSNRELARRLGVSTQTVGKWRRRFLERRMAGLLDQPRSGAPRSISDALVEAVLAKTLHEQPPDAARWSSRRLARALGISQGAVLRIWRTFELMR
jgi:transposase